MNRLFPALPLLLLSVLMAQAQNPNPGSESAHNKQNGPAIETPETPAAGSQPGE